MGCMQSEPYVRDGTPIEAIAFRRKSGKNKRGTGKKDCNPQQVHQMPVPGSEELASPGDHLNSAVSDSPAKCLNKSPNNIFRRKVTQGNELTMSVDSLEAVELEIREKKMVQKKGLFPIWKKHDKCTFCITQNAAANKEEEQGGKEIIQKVTFMDPMDPRLCRQCSSSILSTVQNNLRGTQGQGVNVAIANILAMTALDLTAPASDALLKNRKNAWIQVAGHPGSFAPAGPNTIWKKRMEKENNETKAYQALMEEPLKDMVPTFHREVEYNGEYFIEMDDLLQHFSDPNIMDIKMGKRTFLELEVKNPVLRKDLYEKMVTIHPDAPTEEEKKQEAITKLRYMQFREQESSTADLGFRIEAIRMSGEPPNTNLKKTKRKDQVADVIVKFFKNQRAPLKSLLARLIDIREKFENSTFFKHHEIIGSSLLIMYDCEKTGAWMIDFAKTIPVEAGLTLDHRTPWTIGNHEDGYLSGLDNFILIVQGIVDRQEEQQRASSDSS
ncbi:inositol-trisphosphate 3-kinase homolog [Babylonia areolata]|uniref:inositol-trisphosphate 3-kinase homolog n=1 Tax=Babylonia areolata TaxID=304850 RepID=UPI003FD3D62A